MPTQLRARIRAFAERYTAAWCSQDPAQVAACHAPSSSLTINGGPPAVGREAIAAEARAFMSAFPDLKISMNSLEIFSDTPAGSGAHALVPGDRAAVIYHWTLDGTYTGDGANTGPGGKGKSVHISGYEQWRIGSDGLIAESKGHFDVAEYQRQIEKGADQHLK